MHLGFYYHTPIQFREGTLYTAGYLGCFLDELAKHVARLSLFMHSAQPDDLSMDYALQAQNIRFVALGSKPRPEMRTFAGGRVVQTVEHAVSECDRVLLRGPTHLMHAWISLCDRKKIPVVPMLVGDYRSGNAGLAFSFPKRQVVQLLNWVVDRRERSDLAGRRVLVNSSVLAEKYNGVASEVREIRTTTLSERSFYERADTCAEEPIDILYTGRFEWQKGLRELLEAFSRFTLESKTHARLHLAGWQDNKGPSVQAELEQSARDLGHGEALIFHGKKRVGPELDALYRMADIYVMPSYAEGFPRTLWEAMANSLPVVATSVGSIPRFLRHEAHALLVPPRDSRALADALLRMTEDSELRRRLIRESCVLAAENTLELQVEKLSRALIE